MYNGLENWPEERHVALAEGEHGDELPHRDGAALRGAGRSGGELEAEVLLCSCFGACVLGDWMACWFGFCKGVCCLIRWRDGWVGSLCLRWMFVSLVISIGETGTCMASASL